MMKKSELFGKDGYLALDEVKNQGIFAYWNSDTGKVVLYEVWRGKYKGDYGIHFALDKRTNRNINFIPSLIDDVTQIIREVNRGVNSDDSRDEIGDLMQQAGGIV